VADLWEDLLTCLELRELTPPLPEARSAVFEGENLHLSYHRLFGGQLLAQFTRAAALTCPGKTVKSLHALFPKEGRSGEPVRYEVEKHHEGGTFATLTIIARQSANVIATASVSVHAIEDGPVQQDVAAVTGVPDAEPQVELGLLPWETRSAASLDAREAAAPEYSLWMRTPAAGPELAQGRCFGRGDVLTSGGSLVASYAQEALLRFRDCRRLRLQGDDQAEAVGGGLRAGRFPLALSAKGHLGEGRLRWRTSSR
jgi:acyl-CoA thioesterase